MKKIKQKKSNLQNNLRTVIVTMSVLFFVTITGFYLFNWYINIDISTPQTNTYETQRTSRHNRRSKNRK
ncbi:MAG: hypothetical protein J6A04_05950 [Clostridia bacterium]|nr:hypothetical protein [Clostridia bacterium]